MSEGMLFQDPKEKLELKPEVKYAIENAVREAVKCACPLQEEQVKQVNHFFGMLKDGEIGDGDVDTGIESLRETIKDSKDMRDIRKKVFDKIMSTAIGAFVLGIIGLVAYAIISKIRGG